MATFTVTLVPATVLYNQVEAGTFEIMDAFETPEEMKILFGHITLDNLRFIGVHASNYLPINRTLQRDKEQMLATTDSVFETRNRGMLRDERLRGL